MAGLVLAIHENDLADPPAAIVFIWVTGIPRFALQPVMTACIRDFLTSAVMAGLVRATHEHRSRRSARRFALQPVMTASI
jgi:hypothetical protein